MSEEANAPVIAIDRDLCMGSGLCLVYAAATFAHDDETKAIVVDPHGDALEDLITAAEACPTGALRVLFTEEEGA